MHQRHALLDQVEWGLELEGQGVIPVGLDGVDEFQHRLVYTAFDHHAVE